MTTSQAATIAKVTDKATGAISWLVPSDTTEHKAYHVVYNAGLVGYMCECESYLYSKNCSCKHTRAVSSVNAEQIHERAAKATLNGNREFSLMR